MAKADSHMEYQHIQRSRSRTHTVCFEINEQCSVWYSQIRQICGHRLPFVFYISEGAAHLRKRQDWP